MRAMGSYCILGTATLLVVAAVVASPSGQGRSDQKRIEAQVLAVSAEMERAGEAVDSARLFSFMLDTDRGSIIQNGVFLATRREAMDATRAGLERVSKIEYRWKRQHVIVLSPESALLTAEGESVATLTDGRVFTTPFAQSVVFVLRDGQWKAIHAHQSSPRSNG